MSEGRRKRREAVREVRAQDTLIEKSQVSKPNLDEDMEKILNSIVQGIRNCPPAQPRRKYQKAADIESAITRNARPVPQGKHETPQCSETLSVASSRSTHSQAYQKQQSQALEDRRPGSAAREASERNEETKSNRSSNYRLNAQEADTLKQSSSCSPPARQLAVSKEESARSDHSDHKETVAASTGEQSSLLACKQLDKERKMARAYNPMKRHIGEGMTIRKLPVQCIIDLDSEDAAAEDKAAECPLHRKQPDD